MSDNGEFSAPEEQAEEQEQEEQEQPENEPAEAGLELAGNRDGLVAVAVLLALAVATAIGVIGWVLTSGFSWGGALTLAVLAAMAFPVYRSLRRFRGDTPVPESLQERQVRELRASASDPYGAAPQHGVAGQTPPPEEAAPNPAEPKAANPQPKMSVNVLPKLGGPHIHALGGPLAGQQKHPAQTTATSDSREFAQEMVVPGETAWRLHKVVLVRPALLVLGALVCQLFIWLSYLWFPDSEGEGNRVVISSMANLAIVAIVAGGSVWSLFLRFVQRDERKEDEQNLTRKQRKSQWLQLGTWLRRLGVTLFLAMIVYVLWVLQVNLSWLWSLLRGGYDFMVWLAPVLFHSFESRQATVVALTLAMFAYHWLVWWVCPVYITQSTLSMRKGLLTKRRPSALIRDLATSDPEETVPSRIWSWLFGEGWVNLIFDTAAQRETLRSIKFLPKPAFEQLKRNMG